MNALCLQLNVLSRPLIGPQDEERPELRTDWYERIICDILPEKATVSLESYARGPIPISESRSVLEDIQSRLAELAGSASCLVLDLSDHQWRYTDWDPLEDEWEACLRNFPWVIIILHEHSSVTDSRALTRLCHTRSKSPGTLCVMDTNGTYYDLTLEREERRRPHPEHRRFTDAPSRDAFRDMIIRHSRRRVGHFVTKHNTHTRTYYDVYPALNQPRVYDFVLNEVKKRTDGSPMDVLVGFGLGANGIVSLLTRLEIDLRCTHHFCYDDQGIDTIPSPDGRAVLLVTDVMLSGRTASEFVKKARMAGCSLTGVLAILGMRNSPPSIEGLPVFYCNAQI